MGLKNLIVELCSRPSVTELSRQLAQRAYAAARESIGLHVLDWSRAEARGYVRAKAGPVIRAEAALLVGRHAGLSQARLASVISQASDRVVQSLLVDLNRERSRRLLQRAA
ncbi:MAG TPA: hypothetical protein VG826_08485 [Pirellulales bacterium]|nr:hypothetical protein [Pirellulales bacterium]